LREIPNLFMDENLIHVGRSLAALPGVGNILWVGHAAVPDLPLGTKDEDLFDAVGGYGLNALFMTHDKKIHHRPVERTRLRQARVRAVFVAGANRQPPYTHDLIVRYWDDLAEIAETATGPCRYSLTANGLVERDLRP